MMTLYDRVGGEAAAQRLVHGFYARARLDPQLSPVFAQAAGGDPGRWWAQHLPKMVRFWITVAGGPASYHGAPVAAHDGLGLVAAHFDAWLALWAQVLQKQLPPDCAAELYGRAARMRTVIERHVAGQPLPTPEAYRRAEAGHA
ncbi:truncated hemoglobin [Deinococcus multiflagellatus]|uniref:Truncated hemoglobin n=1 Tax=Deinococcus multiflagellatus TaxID=1656887 RepID=A0ABW1ZSJ8_9DEIO|nr:group III truncated hemoglobin [Deinococcus multiflagellatus]MBZ9713569.1 group III truncated hemoglobin [Deinococcus multiflagellatus]